MIFRIRPNYTRNWFKGDDTRTLCSYLEAKFRDIEAANTEHENIEYISCIHKALKYSNQFLGQLYKSGLWLTPRQRTTIIDSVGEVLKNFSKCAGIAYNLEYTRWKFQPKFHLISEFRYELQCDVEAGRSSINPLVWSCQLDEDFIGKIAVYSRKVSSRTLHLKTCQRYLVSLCASW